MILICIIWNSGGIILWQDSSPNAVKVANGNLIVIHYLMSVSEDCMQHPISKENQKALKNLDEMQHMLFYSISSH